LQEKTILVLLNVLVEQISYMFYNPSKH